MRSFIIALVLFLVMTAAVFTNTAIMTEMLNEMEDMASRLPDPEQLLSVPEGAITPEDVQAFFSEREFYLSLSLSHEDINDVRRSLVRLCATQENRDSDGYREALAELEEAVSHIRQLASLTWDNIV